MSILLAPNFKKKWPHFFFKRVETRKFSVKVASKRKREKKKWKDESLGNEVSILERERQKVAINKLRQWWNVFVLFFVNY